MLSITGSKLKVPNSIVLLNNNNIAPPITLQRRYYYRHGIGVAKIIPGELKSGQFADRYVIPKIGGSKLCLKYLCKSV